MGLIKKIAPLIMAGALAFSAPVASEGFSGNEEKCCSEVIGSAYAEDSLFMGDFPVKDIEFPGFLNASAGYNIMNRRTSEGAFLFPNVRVRLKGDVLGNTWNDYAEVAAGAEYLYGPLQIGVDAGYLKGFKKDFEPEGGFTRAWLYYWNQWDSPDMLRLKWSPMRSQTIVSLDLEATTLTKGLDANARVEEGLVFLEKKDFKALAYAAIGANYDTHWDYGWNNYLRGTLGLRLQKGPFFIFAEAGRQESLNGGNSGPIFYGGASAYFPIGKRQ